MIRTRFTPEMHAQVAHFECGSEPYQREVSDWITAKPDEGGALDALRFGAIDIWLYFTEARELIGFASLAIQHIAIENEEPPRRMYVVPFLALHSAFHGKPEGETNRDRRYSRRILRDLLTEAQSRPEKLPLLGLYVHPLNRAAIALYKKFHFEKRGSYDGDDLMLRSFHVTDER